ncbi:MAG: VanZ family protein [Acidobacteria bacterium]|nr:VanZ family protein [Acidobacteriota bacterium]
MIRWFFRWGPAILMMGFIFIASSTAGSDIPDFGVMNYFAMKGGHLLGYALLGAACFHALFLQRTLTISRFLTVGILVFLYAISDEWHQSYTPGRHPSLPDICIDTAGGFLGMACLHFVRKRFLHPDRQD